MFDNRWHLYLINVLLGLALHNTSLISDKILFYMPYLLTISIFKSLNNSLPLANLIFLHQFIDNSLISIFDHMLGPCIL
jgi:hypothetical protein